MAEASAGGKAALRCVLAGQAFSSLKEREPERTLMQKSPRQGWVQIRKHPTHPQPNPKTEKTGGRNPGPLFFRTLQRLTPAPPSKAHAPMGHTSDAIPTGPASQGLPAHRRGIAWSGTNLWPRLVPRHRQPPICPTVAGHPSADHQPCRFDNKKSYCKLHYFSFNEATNSLTRASSRSESPATSTDLCSAIPSK